MMCVSWKWGNLFQVQESALHILFGPKTLCGIDIPPNAEYVDVPSPGCANCIKKLRPNLGAGTHQCPGPQCKRMVPNKIFACGFHWKNLPWRLRKTLLDAYVPGQTMADQTDDYIKAVHAIEKYWNALTPKKR